MAIFPKGTQNGRFWPKCKGGTLCKNSQNGRFFWLNFGSFKKQEILVRFWPNWYVWTRNLFQFLMIPKALRKKSKLRNDDFFKGYSKWPILTKVQRGDPLQNSRNRPIFWLNFGRFKNRKYLSDFSLIGMDGRGIYSSF